MPRKILIGMVAGIVVLATVVAITILYSRGRAWNQYPESLNAISNNVSSPPFAWQLTAQKLLPEVNCLTYASQCRIFADIWDTRGSSIVVTAWSESGAVTAGVDRSSGEIKWRKAADSEACQASSDPTIVRCKSTSSGSRSVRWLKMDSGTEIGRVELPSASYDMWRPSEQGDVMVSLPEDPGVGGGRSLMTVSNYSSQGKQQWSRSLTVNTIRSPSVWARGEAVYVEETTRDDGSALVLDAKAGKVRPGPAGGMTAITTNGVVLTKEPGSLLAQDVPLASAQEYHGVTTYDSTKGLPLFTTNGTYSSSTTLTARDQSHPERALWTIDGSRGDVALPITYCHGKVIVATEEPSDGISGYDAKSGRQLWSEDISSSDREGISCAGDQVVVLTKNEFVALDADNGRSRWRSSHVALDGFSQAIDPDSKKLFMVTSGVYDSKAALYAYKL